VASISPALVPRQIALSLAERRDLWKPRVRFTESRFYLRLAAGPGWEAWLLTWAPGQSTGLHDHGGSAGAIVVLAGELDESVLVPRASVARRPAGLALKTTGFADVKISVRALDSRILD